MNNTPTKFGHFGELTLFADEFVKSDPLLMLMFDDLLMILKCHYAKLFLVFSNRSWDIEGLRIIRPW